MSAMTYQAVRQAFSWQTVHDTLGWTGKETVNLGATIIDRHADSDATALIWVARDGAERRIAYRDLAEASNRFANLLTRLGVRKGDRVAALMPRVPEGLAALLGAFKVGAIYVPIFTGFGPDAVRFRLEHSQVKLLVTHQEVRSQVPADAATQIICVNPDPAALQEGDLDFAAETACESDRFEPVQCRRDEVAAIIYTSGSTGQPKGGAIATNFLAAIWPYVTYGVDLREDDIFWPTGDPGWGYGFVCYLAALTAGVPIVSVQANPTPALCLELIERYGITNLATTPTLLRSLMAADAAPETPVRTISSCGEPLNDKVVDYFRRVWSVTPLDHFGATEYALPIGNYAGIDMAVKPGSMGLPCPGFTMAVVDEAGNELPAGKVGMIGKKADENCLYWLLYWNDETATRNLVRQGWIVTGDLASRDADGYFWFEGRADDMIKSAGYRIGPFEVESALLKHPAVAEAGVIGKPDALKGQIVKAFILLKTGVAASDALSDELAGFVKRTLGRHQYPREIEFVDSLPKTATGKIQRFVLRQRP